jgi:hypothetical protein
VSDASGNRTADATSMPLSWWPMIFALLILYHPIELMEAAHPSLAEWIFTILGALSFLALIASVLICWHRQRSFLWVIGLLTALWLVYSSHQLPSHVFLDFAALLIPWAARANVRRTTSLLLVLLTVAGVFVYLASPDRGRSLFINLTAGLVTLSVLAASQVLVVRTVLSLHGLSRAAAREHIAKGVSELLSQTLAQITEKSGRAQALLREGESMAHAQQALREIETVEALSRHALADTRRTLRDYRAEARGTGRE